LKKKRDTKGRVVFHGIKKSLYGKEIKYEITVTTEKQTRRLNKFLHMDILVFTTNKLKDVLHFH